MITIIAVCGARRAGKDTLSDYLCRRHGFVKARFADPLKAMVQAAFGFTDAQLEGSLKDVVDDTYGVSPRRVLQFMGTEVMQHRLQELLPGVGRAFWARRLVATHVLPRTHAKVVISDLRFMHEYEALRESLRETGDGSSFQVWRVLRDTSDVIAQDDVIDGHSSEQEWCTIPAHHVLKNAGTEQDLYALADVLLCPCRALSL